MKPMLPLQHSSRGHRTRRRSSWVPRAILLGLFAATLSIPTIGLCASTGSPVPLFVETPSGIPPAIDQAFPPAQLSKQWVRRHHTMGLNPAALEAMKLSRKESKQDISLNLFDAGTRTLELDEPEIHRNKAKVWRGRVRGDQDSDVTLSVRGKKMAGTIVSGQRLYKIEPTEDNRHRLVEIDDDAMRPDHHPLVVPDDGTPAEPPAPEPKLKHSETTATTESVTTAAATTTNTIVDLMVVYTTTARIKQGGLSAMNALIAMSVDLANQAYQNSQIAMRLRLVRTAEVAYTETGNMNTDLVRLRSTSDGFMDQVHTLRDQYKADLVTLIVDNGGAYCGIAYVMANGPRASFASYAFSVTDRDCISNNTLTHELGHNMGDAHDRESGGTGVYPYSYGYRDPIGKFRTIMAYPCPTVSCPRVKYFSNPKILINGRPAGIDYAINPSKSADNARSMNEVRNVIAAWRASTTTSAATAPSRLRDVRPDSRDDLDDDADDDSDDDMDDNAPNKPRKDAPGTSRGKSPAPTP
ncbi:putative Peptidyl-Asp metalloendopeptidase [Candidatus Nitrospira nitrosa]|uniref:Putative Peptidyl-Asp metalloendopeptidase n=1 Tax=Candidatus Nitrospira nitrosa TaxID=1742972 RepID=A0A0S4LCQ5_9BACT|nr:M12 family metallo-peptidase [Candidatus Nitrospira nitrosa]CUS34413.1 putative Peptidyl-Asp metalloendopeptidase [Candidatus Nitrospira nitrosa]